MGIFSQKTKLKAPPPKIRIEKVLVPTPSPRPRPSSTGLRVSSSASASPRVSPRPDHAKQPKSASPLTSSDDTRSSRKRKAGSAAPRRSPASDRVEFDQDSGAEDDDDWESRLDARKRRKAAQQSGDRRLDPNRKLAHPALRRAEGGGGAVDDKQLQFVHAADVASLKQKCVPTLGATEDEVAVELQYPGSRQRERYELVWGKDKIDAVKDIIRVVKNVTDTYLTDEQSVPFNGIIRQLERTSSRSVWDVKAFKAAIDDYNDRLLALLKDGTIVKNLDSRHDIPSNLVALILNQVYDRIVAPDVELLRKYQNGTDNVYGELNASFSSMVLAEKLKMTSDQVFVDLGSGVGNVALHAALEIGCESWGCEMMEEPCNLAEKQLTEFDARCQLWGIAPGAVHLERGDFRTNKGILRVLERADVLLVNNQAFTSQLNDDLVRMFLDLKPGCKIVSLKSFVHDHKSASYNSNDVATTILDVEDLTYPEGFVSWTGIGGTFCISTRK
ncbi:Histone-lysine N-methyltransferase, H3 lysine-79 specific [Pleurostoma richardsiae]|uniref:Histone-lysine N-methyltransferase, H3 lysine-79 specific n=1 Tax=Pleurostoma richardsiae TaxID=41990 RepID=A0AA38RCD4_9PEZI|nr:Histone-lysine N-methyltransferase, H3 lysine-79 specific [Pleurostoma richardsiae]